MAPVILQEPGVFARVRSYCLDARHANPNLEIVFSPLSFVFRVSLCFYLIYLFIFSYLFVCVQLLSAARR